MIGEIVHFTKSSNLAHRRPTCVAAMVMAELPNDKRDLLVFSLKAPAVGHEATPKGERTQADSWHNKNHEDN